MPNPENLVPFKKGYDPKREGNGRPRKFVSQLKQEGYKLSEINDTIQIMLAMTMEELKDTFANSKATVLEKTIAAAIRRNIERGSLESMETLLTRIFGKPTTTLDVTDNTIKAIEIIVKKNNE